MIKNTNIESLGNDYTVTCPYGNTLAVIQVLSQNEILDAAAGRFDPQTDTVTSYLESSVVMLSGFDAIDPLRVLWYATHDDEVVISQVIEYAMEHGYDTIVLEHLEDLEH